MEIEWLMVADAAQVVGNKLYLMGGGWDRLTVNQDFPVNQQLGIALAFKVPWTETNERHSFDIELATEDAQTLEKIGGEFEVGRPAGAIPGSDQRVQIGATANIVFKEPANYVITATVDGEHSRSVVIQVLAGKQSVSQGSPPKAP